MHKKGLTKNDLVTCDALNIKDFGAIPNDGIDDSEAIQLAIDAAIKSKSSSHVYCPSGEYTLTKGVVVSRKKSDGSYNAVTLKISGHIPVYSNDQAVGSATVFNLVNPSFAVAFQNGRNCSVENIMFIGCAALPSEAGEIIKWSAESDALKSNVRTNVNSPSCAIVIDPFHKNISTENRYPGFNTYYTKRDNSGTSMLEIEGCAFQNHYIAVANNPSAYNANGDNIRLVDCHAKFLHTFWSAGQTQSRDNSIQNVYVLFINTFISGRQIGQQLGTPPNISNVSVAGFCKNLVDLSTGFSGFSASQSYFESLWSLGYCNTNFVSFSQCQIKFLLPKYHSLPFMLLESDAVVAFRDCDIAYFSNCNNKIPFLFQSKHVLVSGGQVEGGLILPTTITNAGGENVHNVTYDGVKMKCYESVISPTYSGEILSNQVCKPFVGGATIQSTNAGKKLTIDGPVYSLYYMEDKVTLSKNQLGETYFTSTNPSQYVKGDNLLGGSFIGTRTIRPCLGVVNKVVGSRVYVIGCSDECIGGSTDIYVCDFHYYMPEFVAQRTKNSSRITFVSGVKPDKRYIGKFINLNGFPKNSRITNIQGNDVTLSLPSSQSGMVTFNNYQEEKY